MIRTPKIVAAADAEPVSVAEARAHLEAQAYEDSDVDPIDDAMIEGWIAAAREHCENFTGLSLATRTLEIALDSFPTGTTGGVAIDLPGGPVREIVQIMTPAQADYTTDDIDSDSLAEEAIYADGMVNPGLYVLDNYRKPNQAKPVAAAWPVIAAAANAVRIRYIAGYGIDSDGGEAVPKVIRAAILLVLGHLYRNREATTEEALVKLPLGVESLLRPHRILLGMA